jgi:predicted dehydrogenase
MGGILQIHVYHFLNIAEHIQGSSWLKDKKKSGGGVLFNAGIHSINLLSALLGELSGVSTVLENIILPLSHGEDTAYCKIKSETGIYCFLKLSYLNNSNKNKRFSIQISCKNGLVICDFHNNFILMTDKSTNSKKYLFFNELENEFVINELNHFVHCINNKITPETGINDSIKTSQIINSLYQASK